MDEMVRQAMAKWPNVPACYGWLGLDGRGNWFLRDAQAQAAGSFAEAVPEARGSELRHGKLIEFIGRNYLVEADGCWFFQNGPQRVYVELQFTPWVWRLRSDSAGLHIHSHTGMPLPRQSGRRTLLDEAVRLYLATDRGLGLVHTQDMLEAAQALESGLLPEPEEVAAASLPERFSYVPSPAAALRQ